jgi:hypothetical protein
VQQRRVEGQAFVVLGRESEVIALSRVVKILGSNGRGPILESRNR